MSSDSVNLYTWSEEDAVRLEAEGEAKRRIVEQYYTFGNTYDSDYDAATTAIMQAVQLAQEMKEWGWYLFLRHCRLRFWLSNYDMKHVLSEALELTVACSDEGAQEFGLHIFVYEDLLDCYSGIDPVGYYKEIVAAAQDLLTQIPEEHPGVLFAMSQIFLAAAAVKHTREVDHWVALCQSYFDAKQSVQLTLDIATAHERLERWSEAEQYYLQAMHETENNEQSEIYVKALLGVARARCPLRNIVGACKAFASVLRILRYHNDVLIFARVQEVEGHISAFTGNAEQAVAFLTQAARLYLEFSFYRQAFNAGIEAAELADLMEMPEAMQALAFATHAAGMLAGDLSQVRQQLAAFGRKPQLAGVLPLLCGDGPLTQEGLEDRELAVLKTTFSVYIANGQLYGVTLLLYRLARLYLQQQCKYRQMICYLIWQIVLEQHHNLVLKQDDALNLLAEIRARYDEVAVDQVIVLIGASAPPQWLSRLCKGLTTAKWRLQICAIIAALTGEEGLELEPGHMIHGDYS